MKLYFSQKLPKLDRENTLIIFDSRLALLDQNFKRWVNQYSHYAVSAGEQLKDAHRFFGHVEKIARLTLNFNLKKMTVVAIGGGSVGDFAGFFASIYKRGVRLVHVPSTWLAAIDSAHGGKTALNIAGAKNQIGTFYVADEIYLVKELLDLQGADREDEAFAELYKIALLNGEVLTKKVNQLTTKKSALWSLLKLAIQAKNKIVDRDPKEKKGIRHLLNFGHTMGHVFEVAEKIPHGVAVAKGLIFSIRWSAARGDMSEKEFMRITQSEAWLRLEKISDAYSVKRKIKSAQMRKLLLQDKKLWAQQKVRFIFLKKPGSPLIVSVSVDEVIIEYLRQTKSQLGHV